jgi:hypothetical protein
LRYISKKTRSRDYKKSKTPTYAVCGVFAVVYHRLCP